MTAPIVRPLDGDRVALELDRALAETATVLLLHHASDWLNRSIAASEADDYDRAGRALEISVRHSDAYKALRAGLDALPLPTSVGA